MKKNNSLFLWGLVVLKIIIPYLLQNGMYEPHRDEFLYLAEGNHLDWGFMEVPPLLSVFSWLTHQLGDGMFWIKFWPSLFGAATLYVMGRLIPSLGGGKWALTMLFLAFLFTAYLRAFFLFQPNAPEIFFWTMLVFGLIRYIQTKQNKWLYLFGVSAGLGMLTKYSVAFYIVSLMGGLLLSSYRTIFLNKHFWLAAVLGFLIFLPNLIWQWQHQFPVVYHMSELRETQLQYVSYGDFLKGQLVMYLPVVFVWLCGLYNILFSRSEKRFRFVGYAYILVIIILLAGHGKEYYSFGAYPVLLAFGSLFLERFIQHRNAVWRYALIIIPVTLGLLFLPLLLPLFKPAKLASFYQMLGIDKAGLLKWEDLQYHPLPQDFADMLGWEEMTSKVAEVYHQMPKTEQDSTLIFCDNYGMAGAVNYYRSKYKLPVAYSDNASFLYWLPKKFPIKNIIVVTEDKEEMSHPFVKNFQSAYLSDSVTNPYAREYGDVIFVGKGADENFIKFIRQKIEKDRAKLGMQ